MAPNPIDRDLPETLESLWRWLTVPLLVYCLSLWIRSQSGNYELINFVAKDKDVAVVTGLFATPIAFVSLWLAARYARVCQALSRIERVPRILEKGLEGPTGRLFRLVLYCGVWAIILGSQVHFLEGVLTGSLWNADTCAQVAKGAAEMLTKAPTAAPLSQDFRFGNHHGPTYFPIIETWTWLCGVLGLVAAFVWYLFRRWQVLRD